MGFESSRPMPPEEKQKSAEEKLETGGRVFEFLNRTGFLGIRKSDEQFNEWLLGISYEEYIDYLTRLNGILREVPTGNRSVDGRNVQISFGMDGDTSYLPPASEQKDGLMREIFAAFKEIPDNRDRALLVYYAIQAIHPYADGNGRTGRLAYELMSGEGNEISRESLSELLDHNKGGNDGTGRGRNIFAEKVMPANDAYYPINREVARDVFGDEFLEEYGRIYYSGMVGVGNIPENVPASKGDREFAQKIIGEGDVACFSFRSLAILKLLQESGKKEGEYVYLLDRCANGNEVIFEDIGKKIFGIDGEKFESTLTAEDVSRLIEIHKDIKERFIRKMIDIFTNPGKYRLKDEGGGDILIKDVFRF